METKHKDRVGNMLTNLLLFGFVGLPVAIIMIHELVQMLQVSICNG